MKKILLVGSQHGNELLGDKLFGYLSEQYSELLPSVDFILANPKAHAKGVRYMESDMNRSYSDGSATYEAKQAKKLLSYIQQSNYSLVLDLHTTRCEQEPCFIAYTLEGETKRFVQASSFEHTVIMLPKMAQSSLIGNCAEALSVEVQDDKIDDALLKDICESMMRYLEDTELPLKRKLYKITGLLLKSEIRTAEARILRNFELSAQGFYPVLVGENSYKKNTDYLGFKAELLRTESYPNSQESRL